DTRIVVDSTRDFYSDGDPETVDGCLYIVRRNGTEKIWYVDKTPTEFIIAKNGRRKYLSNAIQNTDPSSINDESKQKRRFDAGCPVYDARAFKVQNHAIWRTVLRPSRDGIEDPMNYELDDFDTTSSIRKIANWNFGLYLTYSQLLGQGLTFYDIQSMGLTEDLKDLGVDARRLRAREETDEEKAASEAAREELKKMDLSSADLAGLKGRNIAGIAKRLARVKKSKNGQAKYDKLLADTKRRAQIARGRDAWFKREIPKTIRALAAVNNESSDFEALGPIKFEDIRPYITATTTSLYGKWTDPVVNFNGITFNPESSVTSFRVQDTRFVVRGAMAKIVHGGKTHYRRVVRSNRNVISVFPRLEGDILARTATISCRMPTPVNINTASRRVLFAIFQSLAVRTKTGTSSVTPAEAGKLADAILARDPEAPFKNHIEFAQFLVEQTGAGVIDTTDSAAILFNAVNPADNRLLRH
ncbi:MAG: hypothetical protein P1V97_32555, partial [Planctomycetota bacterium]|nr:hypothetical protein [Planctomycetota bacterium]